MSQPIEPKRWKDCADEAPPQFRECLAADAAHGPDADVLARMLNGVAVELGRPEMQRPLESRSSPQPSVVSPAGSAIKLGAGLFALAIGVGAYVAIQPELGGPSPQPSAAVVPAPLNAAPTGEVRAVPPARATIPQATIPPVAQPAATPPASQLPPGPSPAASNPLRARRAAQEPPTDPAAELALLERAQRVLATDPRVALELADQHRRDFVRGTFVQEREMLAIDALLRLGERAAADRRARAFLRAFPSSSHRTRLQDLLRSAP